MKYYYADRNNVPLGPVELEDLLKLYAQGAVRPETSVLAEGATAWQSMASFLAQQRPPGALPPPPPVTSPMAPSPSARPAKVQAIAIMTLVSGILNCLGGVGWLVAGLSILLVGVIFTIVPAAYLLVVGILDLVYAAKLMGASPRTLAPARHLAILDIVSIVFCNAVPCVLGIINLVFYADEETRPFFASEDRSR